MRQFKAGCSPGKCQSLRRKGQAHLGSLDPRRGPRNSLHKRSWASHISKVSQSCLTLCDHMDCSLPGPSIHEFSRQKYWSALTFPSQGIFMTQGLNPGLPYCGQILYHLSHQGSPHGWGWLCSNKASFKDTENWIAYHFHMLQYSILLLTFLQPF